MADQAVWAPVATRGVLNVVIRNMRGTQLEADWLTELEQSSDASIRSVTLREHHDICCGAKGCRNHVATDGEHLRYVFSLISSAVQNAQKPGRRDWWYQLAALAEPDPTGDLRMQLGQLREALTISNAKLS